MRTVALIPARGGSKGLSNKNLRKYQGDSLVARAVYVGLETCDDVVVSTDSREIADAGRDAGAVVVMRQPHLAADDTPMLDVVQHFVRCWCDPFDVLVLLQPTSPLRLASDVDGALESLEMSGADSVVSVVRAPDHDHPWHMLWCDAGMLRPMVGLSLDEMPTRRQEVTPAYRRDGTVYAVRRETLMAGRLYGEKCLPLLIPAERSVTIDTEADWRRLEVA